jgi:hypothetical protein
MGRVVLNDGMGDGRRRRELIIHRQQTSTPLAASTCSSLAQASADSAWGSMPKNKGR